MLYKIIDKKLLPISGTNPENIIDDEVISALKTWSSEAVSKIDQSSFIDDSTVSNIKTWSSKKVDDIIKSPLVRILTTSTLQVSVPSTWNDFILVLTGRASGPVTVNGQSLYNAGDVGGTFTNTGMCPIVIQIHKSNNGGYWETNPGAIIDSAVNMDWAQSSTYNYGYFRPYLYTMNSSNSWMLPYSTVSDILSRYWYKDYLLVDIDGKSGFAMIYIDGRNIYVRGWKTLGVEGNGFCVYVNSQRSSSEHRLEIYPGLVGTDISNIL